MQTMMLDGLSNRAAKRLADAGLKTPEDVFRCTDPELLRMPGLGRGTLKEIKGWLEKHPNPLKGLSDRAAHALKYQGLLSREQVKKLPPERWIPRSWEKREGLIREIEVWLISK